MVGKIKASLRAVVFGFINWFKFILDYRKFAFLHRKHPRFSMSWAGSYPILNERTRETYFDAHYIYYPAWAARILAKTKPDFHVDISSTLNFCTLVSAFIPMKFYDFRPAKIDLTGLQTDRADLTHLSFPDASIESLSCMHVVEHIGLGRYGDALDPDGDLRAMGELKRVMKKNGTLLFVVPVGQPVIRFNAHRIYSYDQIVSTFSELRLKQFALVDDSGSFILDADRSTADKQKYGCGCWWFTRE